jgi:hypothetical protein
MNAYYAGIQKEETQNEKNNQSQSIVAVHCLIVAVHMLIDTDKCIASTGLQVRHGNFVDGRLPSCHCHHGPLAIQAAPPPPVGCCDCDRTAGERVRRHGGRRQRDGAAVEHDDDGRHPGPELRVLLHAEQADVDAPQDLLRPPPLGKAAVEQLPHAPAAPVPPDLRASGARHELTPRGVHLQMVRLLVLLGWI